MEWVTKIGAQGAAGFIIGIAVVTWLGEALTTSGAVLIIAISIAITFVLVGILKFIFGRK